ncbi:homoserine dehydrogenase, partial [bacterium]|nr:homoserine dehydrogenase [bacterium]
GIPIINAVKTALRANDFTRVAGILNGTTNYILTKMEHDEISYSECLKLAQDLGYAEADPTGDVEGFDTMYKTAILANIVFHKRIDVNKIYREGISKISDSDIKHANDLGYKIKLIGLAQKVGEAIDIRVHPMLVPQNNVLSLIDNALNAVQVEGLPVGQVMFTGPGAGEFPTASSVVGDVLAIKSQINTCEVILPLNKCNHSEYAEQLNILDTKSCYYISINAENKVGTIGAIGTVCAKNSINLSNIIQKGIKEDGTAEIIVITEIANEKDMQKTINELKEQGIKINNLIRTM